MSFKHKKKYGQNFLNDQNILSEIISVSNISNEEDILEIGPGDGALTARLLEKAKTVSSVEIDDDLKNVLETKFEDKVNFRLLMGDILDLDIAKEFEGKIKVVANIPYYITSPIINKLIEYRDIIDEVYIMIQKEVAERITAEPGKKARSILTLAVEYFAQSELLFYIPKEKFTPAPKVDSAFLQIKLRKDRKYENAIEEIKFFKYIKAAFANKRKNILNNFKNMGYEKDKMKEIFEKNGIDTNRRAESFSIDEFLLLIKLLEEMREA